VSWIIRPEAENADGSIWSVTGHYTLVLTSVHGSAAHGTLDARGYPPAGVAESVHVAF
jgi:hypothetical protein